MPEGAGKFYLWTDYLAKLQSNLPSDTKKLFKWLESTPTHKVGSQREKQY